MDLTQLRLRTRFDDFEVCEPRLSNQTEQTLSGDSGSTRKEIETKRKRKKNEKNDDVTISINWIIYLTFFTIILFFTIKKYIF